MKQNWYSLNQEVEIINYVNQNGEWGFVLFQVPKFRVVCNIAFHF